MKKGFFTRLCIVILIILAELIAYGCKVFDFFGKNPSAQHSSAPYAPTAVPETLEQEQPIVSSRLNELSQALIAKDANRASELCVNEDFYKQIFLRHRDRLPALGEAIKKGRLTSIGAGYTSHGSRIGEVSLKLGSDTFGITVIKDKGQWFFQDL